MSQNMGVCRQLELKKQKMYQFENFLINQSFRFLFTQNKLANFFRFIETTILIIFLQILPSELPNGTMLSALRGHESLLCSCSMCQHLFMNPFHKSFKCFKPEGPPDSSFHPDIPLSWVLALPPLPQRALSGPAGPRRCVSSACRSITKCWFSCTVCIFVFSAGAWK